MISAVAHYKKVHSTAYHNPTPKDPVDTLSSHMRVSKKIYECLINEKASTPSRSQEKCLGRERHGLFNSKTGKIRTAYHFCVQESQSLERSSLNFFTGK